VNRYHIWANVFGDSDLAPGDLISRGVLDSSWGPLRIPMTPMNSMATLPSENNRKRRRVDDTEFCTGRDHEAALQANNSQDDENNSQDDKDTLRNHEHVDEVAGGGPGKAYQDMFSKLDLI
jgi:hypothetical protein